MTDQKTTKTKKQSSKKTQPRKAGDKPLPIDKIPPLIKPTTQFSQGGNFSSNKLNPREKPRGGKRQHYTQKRG